MEGEGSGRGKRKGEEGVRGKKGKKRKGEERGGVRKREKGGT